MNRRASRADQATLAPLAVLSDPQNPSSCILAVHTFIDRLVGLCPASLGLVDKCGGNAPAEYESTPKIGAQPLEEVRHGNSWPLRHHRRR